MTYDNFTLKAQEAINLGQQVAGGLGQQTVDTVHLLSGIYQADKDVIEFLLKKCGVNIPSYMLALDAAIKKYPKVEGGGDKKYLSNDSNTALARAKDIMTKMGDSFIALEVLFMAILEGKDKASSLMKQEGISKDCLKAGIKELRKGKPVTEQSGDGNYNALKKFAVNLNERAEEGKLDPIIGRDEEIRRVLQILSRRKKNNPLLIGEAGVGKTAIVEGIAWRIVNKDVPENLATKTIYSLDMAALIAGAKYKGEFEERLKSVIKEVQESDGEIILFVDEIHTLIGAGGGNGAMDAANILKPALARGELHTVGATTLDEYQKYFEKDKALVRRFQTVLIDEPSIEDTISILRGIQEKYEVYHKIDILDEALVAAAELSDRYLSTRMLPDKAIDLIDEAAARLRLELDSVPEEVDELDRNVRKLEIEREGIKREKNEKKLKMITEKLANAKAERDSIRAKWQNEKEIVDEIVSIRLEMDENEMKAQRAERDSDFEKVAKLRYGVLKELEAKMEQAEQKLNDLPEDHRFTTDQVKANDIAEVIAKWTGIPVNKMMQSDKDKLLNLEENLGKRLIGQKEAVTAVSDAVRRSRSGLQDPNRPIGSFIFLGPTGVGKTELAKALAEELFDDEDALTRIDMSEYQEKHAVSRLVGAPPGYVGYDEGGQLTEAVRRKPYSIILLDEIEKAHPDTFNILLQVLDDGRLTDNKGREADFKNTIIIMTSNLGSDKILENFEDLTEAGEEKRDEIIEATREEVFDALKDFLRPEFINRIDEQIMFLPLTKPEIKQILFIQLNKVKKMLAKQGMDLEVTDKAADFLVDRGYNPTFGARPLKRVIQKYVINELSKYILKNDLGAGDTYIIDAGKGFGPDGKYGLSFSEK